MGKSIHVVNGDATAEIFRLSELEGEVLVWREMLCDGPIVEEVGSDDFWMNRYHYFKKLEIERLEYFDASISEIIKLEDVEGVDEVILWFEFDVFCQFNLMAVCSYLLKSFRKDVTYSLVCTGYEKDKDRLQYLSDYLPKEFPKLFNRRVKITKNNLEFADQVWKVLVRNQKEELKNYNFKHAKFRYLQKAIEQHLKRFPLKNGLNEIENKILKIINENSCSKREIIKELLIWQNTKTVYGFGDLQYINYLKNLDEYFKIEDEKYRLNEVGLKKINYENN
jgi:hypothetical protein